MYEFTKFLTFLFYLTRCLPINFSAASHALRRAIRQPGGDAAATTNKTKKNPAKKKSTDRRHPPSFLQVGGKRVNINNEAVFQGVEGW